MAAYSEDEPISPLENRSYSNLNSPVGVESRSISRSPSVSSFDRWPSLLVSRRPQINGKFVYKDLSDTIIWGLCFGYALHITIILTLITTITVLPYLRSYCVPSTQ